MGFSAKKLTAFDIRSKIICNNDIPSRYFYKLNSTGNSFVVVSPNPVIGPPTGNEFIKVFSLNGNSWEQKGNTIMLDQIYISRQYSGLLSINSTGNRISFSYEEVVQSPPRQTQYRVKVLEFNGVNWVQLGDDILSEPSFNNNWFYTSANLSMDRFLMVNRYYPEYNTFEYLAKAKIVSWNGASWSEYEIPLDAIPVPGAGFQASYGLISPAGDKFAIYKHNDDSIRFYSFNGSNWQEYGIINGVYDGRFSINSSWNICASTGDASNKVIKFHSWNGTQWVTDPNRSTLFVESPLNSYSDDWRFDLFSLFDGNGISFYEDDYGLRRESISVYYWNNSEWKKVFDKQIYTEDYQLSGTAEYSVTNASFFSEDYIAYTMGTKMYAWKLFFK